MMQFRFDDELDELDELAGNVQYDVLYSKIQDLDSLARAKIIDNYETQFCDINSLGLGERLAELSRSSTIEKEYIDQSLYAAGNGSGMAAKVLFELRNSCVCHDLDLRYQFSDRLNMVISVFPGRAVPSKYELQSQASLSAITRLVKAKPPAKVLASKNDGGLSSFSLLKKPSNRRGFFNGNKAEHTKQRLLKAMRNTAVLSEEEKQISQSGESDARPADAIILNSSPNHENDEQFFMKLN